MIVCVGILGFALLAGLALFGLALLGKWQGPLRPPEQDGGSGFEKERRLLRLHVVGMIDGAELEARLRELRRRRLVQRSAQAGADGGGDGQGAR